MAQVPAYPQQMAMRSVCPRWRDSTNTGWRTGFAVPQVLVSQRKKAVVHIKHRALLLRLCIYKEIKKKTEEQLRAPASPFRFQQRRGRKPNLECMHHADEKGCGTYDAGLQGERGRRSKHGEHDQAVRQDGITTPRGVVFAAPQALRSACSACGGAGHEGGSLGALPGL